MDQQQSSCWVEALKQERKARERWQETYLQPEALKELRDNEKTVADQWMMTSKGSQANKRVTERDAMESR